MRDPFASALGPLFRAPGSVAAVYDGRLIRVIRSQPTVDMQLPNMMLVADSNIVMVQRTDAPAIRDGETIRLGNFSGVGDHDPLFEVTGEPRLDLEGLTWTCELGQAR